MNEEKELRDWLVLNSDILRKYDVSEIVRIALDNGFDPAIVTKVLSHFRSALGGGEYYDFHR